MWRDTEKTVILPRDKREGKETSEVLTSIVKVCWDALNEWATALNTGIPLLKETVTILLNTEDNLPDEVHEKTKKLNQCVATMEKVIRTLKGTQEQVNKIIEIEDKKCPNKSKEPIFETLPLTTFAEIIAHIKDGYEKETLLKQSSLNPLSTTRHEDTLNTSITIWCTSVYLPQPHLYHIKILLKETGQL